MDEMEKKSDAGAAFAFGLFFGAIFGAGAGVLGCSAYHENHPVIVHDDSTDINKPLKTLTPPAFYKAGGYDILFGRAAVDPSYTNQSRGQVPVFVRNAPNDKPFRIACQLLDANGALQGGGSGVVANGGGGQLTLYLSTAHFGRLSCQVHPVTSDAPQMSPDE